MIHFFALNKNNANFEKPEVFLLTKRVNDQRANKRQGSKIDRYRWYDAGYMSSKEAQKIANAKNLDLVRLPSSRTACVQDNGLRQVYV